MFRAILFYFFFKSELREDRWLSRASARELLHLLLKLRCYTALENCRFVRFELLIEGART